MRWIRISHVLLSFMSTQQRPHTFLITRMKFHLLAWQPQLETARQVTQVFKNKLHLVLDSVQWNSLLLKPLRF